MVFAGIFAGVHQVDTCLVDSNGILRDQNTNVGNAGILRHGAAVAIDRHVFHHVHIDGVALKVFHNRHGRIRHSTLKFVGIGTPDLLRLAGTMDIGFTKRRSVADGQLLQRTAVATHGMALEMGQHQGRVVIGQILAHIVFLNHLAVGNVQHQIGARCVQQIHRKILLPAVLFKQLQVLFGGITLSLVCRIALDDGATHMIHHRFPEIGPQEILVALLAGMDLDGHISGQLLVQQLIHLQHLFGCDSFRKIDFGSHKNIRLSVFFF